MPVYQIKCRELVYVDRYYEIMADSASNAVELICKSRGDAGELIDEQMQDTHSFEGVIEVTDESTD